MLMVSLVNLSIWVHPYSPAAGENIYASQTRKKCHMCFGTLLPIFLRLAFFLIIFIIPLALFFQGEYGYIFLPSIWQWHIHYCSSFCAPVCSPALSDVSVFGTPISLVATFKAPPACDLDCMDWTLTKPSPSVNIWAHVFPIIYFFFANNVSV